MNDSVFYITPDGKYLVYKQPVIFLGIDGFFRYLITNTDKKIIQEEENPEDVFKYLLKNKIINKKRIL